MMRNRDWVGSLLIIVLGFGFFTGVVESVNTNEHGPTRTDTDKYVRHQSLGEGVESNSATPPLDASGNPASVIWNVITPEAWGQGIVVPEFGENLGQSPPSLGMTAQGTSGSTFGENVLTWTDAGRYVTILAENAIPPAPVILWNGETEEQQRYYGENGQIAGGTSVGAGRESEFCFIGTPPVDGVASFRVHPSPPVLEQPYLSFWIKATEPCTVRVSFLYFDEAALKARVSNEVSVDAGVEWGEVQLAMSNWLNTGYTVPRIQFFRVATGRVGVDVYVDDLVNMTPAAAEPEPQPEPEPTTPRRWRVTGTVDLVVEEIAE